MSSNASLYDHKILSSIAEDNNMPEVANFINQKQINRIALMGLNEDLLKRIIPDNSVLRTQMDYFIKNIIPKTNEATNKSYFLKQYKRRSKSIDSVNVQLKKPWPAIFPYPKHRLDKPMLNKLQSQDALTHRDTINLIQALFLELKDYIKFYATASIYEDAARSIIEAFPYLKDNSDTGFNTYRVQLKNKFKEYRRSLENPEILDKRTKFGKRKVVSGNRKRRPNKKFQSLEEADLNDLTTQSNNTNDEDDDDEEFETSDEEESEDDGNATEEESFVEKHKTNQAVVIETNVQTQNSNS